MTVIAPIRVGALWKLEDRPRPLRSTKTVTEGLLDALGHFADVRLYRGSQDMADPRAHQEMGSFADQVDLVVGDVYPGGMELALAVRAARGANWPVVVFAHGAAPKGMEWTLFPWSDWLRPSDAFVFSSQADLDIWARLADDSQLSTYLLPLPVDGEFFAVADRDVQRGPLGLAKEDEVVVYAGRINVQKNLHGLLSAFAIVCRNHPHARLVVAGPEDAVVQGEFLAANTGYRSYLVRQTTRLGVEDHVSFVGELDRHDLAQLFAIADVAVSLSFYHRENFGLALAEAQAAGTPVVASAWGGHRDVVDPDAGVLVEAAMTEHGIRVDWGSAGHAIDELLSDPEKRLVASASARAWAARFRRDHVAQQLETIIRTTIERLAEQPTRPAYRPSAFARVYEGHKTAHGWYEADHLNGWNTPDPPRPWRRPMFAGDDYDLYEELLGPYASVIARRTDVQVLAGDAYPYLVTPVRADPDRRLIVSADPIWPHHRYLDASSWEVFMACDGSRSTGEVAGDDPSRRADLWRFWIDGFLALSLRPVEAGAFVDDITR